MSSTGDPRTGHEPATARSTVFVVDDDNAIRSGLSLLLKSFGFDAQSFPSGEAFLDRCGAPLPESCMVILDLSMPGLDGLAVQARLRDAHIDMPVVFLSGDGDIRAAVDAVRHGAIDFLEKPVDSGLLIERVESGLHAQLARRRENRNHEDVQSRIATLTPREMQILEFIADGRISKAIAVDLGISERTVELHRSHVLKKMGVRNATELLNHVIPALDRNRQGER